MKPNVDIALEFLRRLYPEGPWHLTWIDPKDRSIGSRHFGPGEVEAMRRWIEGHNTKTLNIYYSLNLPIREKHWKLEREDIAEMRFVHVDVDPRVPDPGADLDKHNAEEQDRIRKLLADPPAGIPRPTALVYSGGGFNALWRLAEPIVIGGDLGRAEEAKLYNLQLEFKLGGDHCHNVDRILRVPGTVNWPDAKKRKKGRVPTLAQVVFFEDSVYPLSTFTRAEAVQTPGPGTGFSNAVTRVKVSGNVKRLDTVDDLPENVDAKTKMLIVQGGDPDDPTAYPSRSELLFRVCCGLVRGGCDDEMIFAVITDPGWPISSSVLDKGSGFEKYALRQIERAKEEVISKDLRMLNERYAVIGNMGGKCRIVEEVTDHSVKPARRRITKQSFDDFRNRYCHLWVDTGLTDKGGNPVMKPMGKWWIEHPLRRQYDSIVFAPGMEIPDAYNLWRGFNYPSVPGNKHESFLAHILDNLCDGNREHFDYLIRWMARVVQSPAESGEVAIVFRGRMGTGKGLFAKWFGRLWGRHYLQVSNAIHLVGQFTAHLRDVVVLFADEAFYAGDKKHASVLKSIITEETIMMEAKGIDAEPWPNFLHIIMATNEHWAIPAGHDERRFLVLDVNPAKMQDVSYFGRIDRDLEDGGYQSLLHHLSTMDLSDYQVRHVPKTKALQEQKQMSMSSEEEWWLAKLMDGVIHPDLLSWEGEVRTALLHADYIDYARDVGVNRRATATALGRFFRRVVPDGLLETFQKHVTYTDDKGREAKRRARFYKFPDLATCRRHWDEHFGGPIDWPTIEFRGDFPHEHDQHI